MSTIPSYFTISVFPSYIFHSKCLFGQITANVSASVSSISLSAPARLQPEVNLAIGRVSGSLETWIWNTCSNRIENTSACHVHDQVVKLHLSIFSLIQENCKMSNITIGDRFIMGFGWLLFIQLQSGLLTFDSTIWIAASCILLVICKLCFRTETGPTTTL
jgi:hypothetical protein